MIVYFWNAEKGKKESSNPHLAEGLSHLKEAVDHGQQGHAKVAAEHAEEALKHLRQVHQ